MSKKQQSLLRINKFEYPTFEAAWEGINEHLANNQAKIMKKGGGCYGNEMVSYDNFIYIYKAWLNPNFNFGLSLGYKYKKWSKLVNNYVDLNYLDLVKSEVVAREKKKASNYNYTFHFSNSHGSGKDCLISLSFCRRKGQKCPQVIYTTRASEATSRLVFDFFLIQRMVEYVYGEGVDVEVLCYIPFIFINIERFVMYMGYKGRDILKPKKDGYSPFQTRCLKKYDEFLEKPLDLIKYKVHKRAAMQVKKDEKGRPIANAPDLFAKDLKLIFKPITKTRDIAKLDASM